MKSRINFKLKKSKIYVEIIGLIFIFLILYLTSLYSFYTHDYLLFHTLAEIFSIIIGCSVFVVAYNSRKFSSSDYFLFLGTSFLFIGIIDLIHTLAYEGMQIFTGYTSNLPTQLWIFARYFQAITLLTSIFLTNKEINMKVAFAVFSLITTVFIILIFLGLFPDCFLPDSGLTMFKKVSEYIIIAILAFTIIIFYKKRKQFDLKVLRIMILAIIFTMAAEFSFTFYISVYGISNLIGHFFKILSFYMIYKALITKTLRDPYSTLFRNLKESQKQLILERNKFLKSYNTLQSIITTANNGFLVINENGRIVQIDDTYKDIYYKLYNERINTDQNIFELPKNELNRNITEILSKKLETIKVIEFENGKNLEISTSITKDQDSSIDILFMIYDVSNIIQRDLFQRKIISTVSHELRNPIHVINIATENLKKYDARLSEEEKKSIINMISKNSILMQKLIEDLSVISSDDIQRMRINRKKIILIDLLNEIISEIKILLEEKAINLDFKHKSEVEIYADPLKISQIFRILIDNAIKYSNKKSTIKIEIIDNYQGEYNPSSGNGILVKVIDMGRGIKEEDQKRIFDRFFRSDDVKDIKGTGLGLSIAKELAILHNGDIYVESEYKKGSTFSIFLPKK